MATTPIPASSRTVANHQTSQGTTIIPPRTPTPTSASASTAPSQEIKRIQLSAPTDISIPSPGPSRTNSTFPPNLPTPPASSSSKPLSNPSNSNGNANATPSTSQPRRGVKLDQVAERQANAGGPSGTPAGLSAKALGKRKRTVEEEEIIHNAGQVFRDNIDRDTSYFTSDYLPVHPFESGRDIVDRLLPFHLWQIHDQDLDCRPKDAKRRMTERVGVEKLVTRHISLLERLRKAQVRQDNVTDGVDVIQISQAVVQTMTDTRNQLQSQLRDVRAENDRLTYENRRKEEARRAAMIAAGEKPLPRTGPGRPPGSGTGTGMGTGTPTMSRTASTHTNGASTPGTPSANRGSGMGVPAGQLEVPPSPIAVTVPFNLRADLIRLEIITSNNGKSQPPGRVVKKTDDGTGLMLSVYPAALNPTQLNFLAGVLTRQQQQVRKAAASPSIPSSPATSASSPKTVDTS